MKRPHVVGTALLLAALGAVAVQAQSRFEVTARAGMLIPTEVLGPVAAAGPGWYLQLGQADRTPAFEIAARVDWPARSIGTRLLGTWVVPTEASGFFNCNPGLACPAVLLPSDAEIGMLALVGDVIVSPLDGRFRPWAALGAGIRNYEYSWSDAVTLVNGGSHSETVLALHTGIGLDIDLPFGTLQIEAADFWSPEGNDLAPAAGGQGAPRRNAQHDLAVNIGWRLFRF